MLNRRFLLRAAFAASLALPLSLTSCEGMDNPLKGDPSGWEPEEAEYVQSRSIKVPDFDYLWEHAKFMIQTEQYAIDAVRTNREKKHLVSRWKNSLSPSRFKGVRRRVWMNFEEVGENTYVVDCAVQAQRNEDIEAPTELMEAVWKELPGGDDTRARFFVYKLEYGFRDENPEEEKPARARGVR